MRREIIKETLLNHRWKIIGSISGFFISMLIIFMGLFKSLFIIFCVLIGYYIGRRIDNNENLSDVLDKILPPGNR